MCAPRLAKGLPTACASVCPTGATTFGERAALIREARRRIAEDPKRYVDHIYGLEEAGGTSVIMLSGVSFGSLGLRENLPHEPMPMLTWKALSKVPDVLLFGAALLYGIHWITQRRAYVRLMEGPPEAAPLGGAHRPSGDEPQEE
jgi:formate dehydrogenase iron-sulfur subunit